uniref:Uncharacterized protein n=2 Tax=Emiliania huxleyi TaxID=2903 RepID=A0A7S3TIF4_EMIHU
MRVHVASATCMWLLGGVQMCGGWLRREHPALHRVMGYCFLLCWALFVGPTACYLSLLVRGDSLFGTLSSLTLLDVTFLSYYCFFRAWRVARLRSQGARSLQLHGNLMGLGCLGTMSQLPQRFFQVHFVALRWICVRLLGLVSPPHAVEVFARWVSHEALTATLPF